MKKAGIAASASFNGEQIYPLMGGATY